MSNTKGQRKEVWELRKAACGVPNAGNAFARLISGTMVEKCKMRRARLDPRIHIRIDGDSDGKVMGCVIAITWTDDARYFGTDPGAANYEATMAETSKCKPKGEGEESFSIKTRHDIENGTLELKQPAN